MFVHYLTIKGIIDFSFSFERYLKIENLIILILPPIIEEFIYRWGLVFSPKSFAFMIVSIPTTYLISGIGLFLDSKNFLWVISIFCIMVISILFYFILMKRIKRNINSYAKFHEKNFKFILWISIILFTISHYSNYEAYSFLMKIYFLAFIFFSGYVFSKVRISEGILFSILLHIACLFSSGLYINKI